ncbi:MAG: hypothetical protein ACXVCP_02650 [Bdellovibrio sp.]
MNKKLFLKSLIALFLIVNANSVIAAERTSFSIGLSLSSLFSDPSDTEEGICNALAGMECIKLGKNDVVSVTEDPSKKETHIFMGSSARLSARILNLHEDGHKEFLELQRIRLFDDSPTQSTIGGLTEIAKGSGIFVTAAHVLKSYGIKNLSSKINPRGLKPRYYTFFNPTSGSLTEDLVFIKLLSTDSEPNDNESINTIREWINNNNAYPVSKGETATVLSYSRTQTKNDLDNLIDITISTMSADGKYIIIPAETLKIPMLTKSSSGSLILKSNKNSDDTTIPTAVGLVQCIEESAQLIYVLDLSHLSENGSGSVQGFSPSEFNQLIESFKPTNLLQWPKACKPIDGRGG